MKLLEAALANGKAILAVATTKRKASMLVFFRILVKINDDLSESLMLIFINIAFGQILTR
jgi:hypothetical protein